MSTATATRIPANLSRGRATWIWQKTHAARFTGAEAQDIRSRFEGGGKLVAVPVLDEHAEHPASSFLLCNSAGCFIFDLIDDDAPYTTTR